MEGAAITFLDALVSGSIQTFDIAGKTFIITVSIVLLDQSFYVVDNLLQKVEVFLNLSENVDTVLSIGPVLPVFCNFFHFELSDFFKVVLPCSDLIRCL